MNILLFGAPGAGKGTQSSLLVEKLSMTHISTGDLFRSAIANKSPMGIEAKAFMDKGQLVPDDVVTGMVEEEFKRVGVENLILDGFPRTVGQAQSLNVILKNSGSKIDKVIFLDVPQSILVDRLCGRRVCRNCGSVFHISGKPSKIEGVCDVCNGELYQREDDSVEVISKRLEAYERNTQPLKEFYEKDGLLELVDGQGKAEDVFSKVLKVMKN